MSTNRGEAVSFGLTLMAGGFAGFLAGVFLSRAAMGRVTATAILPHVPGFTVEEHGDSWVVIKDGRSGVSPTLAGAFADWAEAEQAESKGEEGQWD